MFLDISIYPSIGYPGSPNDSLLHIMFMPDPNPNPGSSALNFGQNRNSVGNGESRSRPRCLMLVVRDARVVVTEKVSQAVSHHQSTCTPYSIETNPARSAVLSWAISFWCVFEAFFSSTEINWRLLYSKTIQHVAEFSPAVPEQVVPNSV